MEELIERPSRHHGDGAAFIDEAFVDEIECNPDCSFRGTFGVARLQHKKLTALDGKLEILHVAIVPLEAAGDLLKLRVHLRLMLGQVGDLLRRTDPRDHVFTLRVG